MQQTPVQMQGSAFVCRKPILILKAPGVSGCNGLCILSDECLASKSESWTGQGFPRPLRLSLWGYRAPNKMKGAQ